MTQATVEKMLQEILGQLYHGRRALGMMPIQKFKGLRTLLLEVRSEAYMLGELVDQIIKTIDYSPKVK